MRDTIREVEFCEDGDVTSGFLRGGKYRLD